MRWSPSSTCVEVALHRAVDTAAVWWADVPESDGLYTLVIDESEASFSADEATSIKVDLAGDEYP